MSTYENSTGKLSPQSLLRQRYVILRQVGQGGMGAVYEAIDTSSSNRSVAIKEMSQAHLNPEQLRDATMQFQREAHLLHGLSHINLPRVYDAFTERERSYLVMDFISGKTLLQKVHERHEQPLPVIDVLHHAFQLCSVLAYLHQQHPPIIFRDVKPTNIMVTEEGHVYLIDFGIARIFKEGQAQDTLLLGSPGYASPEQHGMAQTTPRSDLYSLGATLHYCLTGKDPYKQNYRFAFPAVRTYNPQIPLELDQLISRLLSMNEAQRPDSAIEVQTILSSIIQQSTDHTSALTPSGPAFLPTQYMPPVSASDSNKAAPHNPTVAVSPPHAQRVTQPTPPFQRVPTSGLSNVWTMSFTVLFALILLFTVGISLLAFNLIDYSDHAVELGLSLVLVVAASVASSMVKRAFAKNILLLTGLAAVVAAIAFALQTLADRNILTNMPISSGGVNILFTIGLAGAALISLFCLIHPLGVTNRLILLGIFGLALLCAVLQFASGDLDVTKHILILVALIALIQGVLVAAKAERVLE